MSRLIPSFRCRPESGTPVCPEIPAPFPVIPAKAGIHTPPPTGVLDSGLRRNDGGGGNDGGA